METKPSYYDALRPGIAYFYVHFLTEVLCYYALGRLMSDTIYLWIVPLTYDLLAFVPQSLVGAISDRYRRLPLGEIGMVLMSVGVALLPLVRSPYLVLLPLCAGNACAHVAGAEATLRCAGGKLAPSAIFVAGGTFGIVIGKLFASSAMPNWGVILFAFTALPLLHSAQKDTRLADAQSAVPCAAFRCADPRRNPAAVIVLAVCVVLVRSYMGYGIPMSWKTTQTQTTLLFVTMGVGKALGGLLADRFGVRRVAIGSAAAALPLLLLGDRVMFVSLLGVMLFSMTMSVTLAVLVSVMPGSPGLAFGLTTIGLVLGTVPVFFFRFASMRADCILLAVLTLFCLPALYFMLRKDEEHVCHTKDGRRRAAAGE